MFEKSIGGVIFNDGKVLLLKYKSLNKSRIYWDFPKGKVEEGEEELDTLRREVMEETGIEDLVVLDGFRHVLSYVYKRNGKLVRKEVVFYVCKTKQSKVIISSEHYGFKWVPKNNCLAELNYKESKDLYSKALDFVSNI